MNALDRARASINAIPALLRRSAEARRQTQQRVAIKPRATQLFIKGAMVQILDADTGRCLGFRQSYLEAEQLAKHLESGQPLEA